MLHRLLRPRPARAAGQALYAACVEQARQPALYTTYGIPDTPEGRFEAYNLHVVLMIDRLQAEGPQGAETSQALFDAYVKSLDHGLRELGVGDVSVGKKMRRLGEAIYGRAKSYQAAFANLPNRTELEALVARTVYAQAGAADGGAHAPAMSDYVLSQRDRLAAQPAEGILSGKVQWSPA